MFILRNATLLLSAVALVPSAVTAQITVTEAPPVVATIKIDASRPASYRIPRTIFGSFLEPIGNSTYNGLWAEIIVNPSFEGNLWDTSHVAAMVREEPGLSRASALGLPLPWEPIDASQGNRYEPHWGGAPNSWRSLEVIGVPGRETGVKQKVYLPVHRVLRFEGSLFARHLQGSPRLTIEIRSHDSKEVLASANISVNDAGWSKYSFGLELAAGSLHRLEPADFAILVDGDGRIDLDNVQLFPADAINRLDPDEVRMAREMHTPLVRFGGNFTSGYHWKDGIGPEDKRLSMLNIAWGIPEYNTFGTDEFLNFCKLIGAEPQIAVNLGSGTPQEAAEWVKYVNERVTNTGLHWELGNELWGTWNLGWPTLEQLPGRTREFSEAIHAVDPAAKLIATGQDPDVYQQWNAAQLTNPPRTFDYLSTHFVVTTDATLARNPNADFLALATFALPVELGRRLHKMQDQINETSSFARKAHIAFTEWLYVAHRNDAPRFTNMAGAIGAAGLFNMLIKNADIVPVSDMTGIMEFAGIWKERSQVYAAPAYYIFKMYAGADAVTPVSVESHSGSYAVHNGVSRLPEIADVPYLDVVAAKNDTGDALTLFVVNRHLSRDFETEIELRGFSAAETAKVESLHSDSLYDENTAADPNNVTPSESSAKITSGHIHYAFPRESVTVLTLKKK